MVIPAMIAEVNIEVNMTKFALFILFVMATTIQAPPAPHNVLQISPTTSAQKEQTFSLFLQSISPTSAPFFFSFSHFKNSFISADAAAMPSISNTTAIKIKKERQMQAKTTPILDSIVWLKKPKNIDIQIAMKNIRIAHTYFLFIMDCTEILLRFFTKYVYEMF